MKRKMVERIVSKITNKRCFTKKLRILFHFIQFLNNFLKNVCHTGGFLYIVFPTHL